MKPGAELDALIAVKVMGHVLREDGSWRYNDQNYSGIPSFSTDIAAAWEVVEKLMGLCFCVRIECWDFGNFNVMCLNAKETHFGNGETMPHAICLTALKTVPE